MKEVAGYFVPIDIVHQVLNTLNIPDDGIHDDFLENPINDWLADQKKDILAAVHDRSPMVGTPDDLGVMFLTQFVEVVEGAARPKETEKDMEVKKWLVEEGGAPEEKVEWLRFYDTARITLNGTKPVRRNVRPDYHKREVYEPVRQRLVERENARLAELKKMTAEDLEELRAKGYGSDVISAAELERIKSI